MWRPRDHERYIGSYDPEHEMPDPDRGSGDRWQSDAYRHNARDTRFAYRWNPDRIEERYRSGPYFDDRDRDRDRDMHWRDDFRDREYGRDFGGGRPDDYRRDNYGRDNYGREPYGREPYGREPYGRGSYGHGAGGYGGGGYDRGGGYPASFGGSDRGWDRGRYYGDRDRSYYEGDMDSGRGGSYDDRDRWRRR